MVRNHPLSLTKQDRLYRMDLRRVNAALLQPENLGYAGRGRPADESVGERVHRREHKTFVPKDEPDFPRLIFLRLLLSDIGLLTRKEQAIRAVDHPEFLDQEPADRIQRSFTHWQNGTFWNEVLSIPNITVADAGPRTNPVPKQIVRARKSVLKHIAEQHKASIHGALPGQREHWVPIRQLIDRIRLADYDFLLPRNYGLSRGRSPSALAYGARQAHPISAYRRYISHRSPYISYGNEMEWSFSPPFSDETEGWQVVEAGFIRAILLEPMHWMGLVHIGYADDRPVAYRLTPVGAWVLGIGPMVDIPKEDGRVIVQPNFEIVALDPVSDRTLAELGEFAERTSAERAIKYHLTRESVYRAQKKGWTAARIIHALQRMTRTQDVRTRTHDVPTRTHDVPTRTPDVRTRTHDVRTRTQDVRTQSDSDQHHREHTTFVREHTTFVPLPQNIVRTLEEWQHLHERITIHRQVSLLQAVDAKLLDRLMQDQTINAHLVTRPDAAPRQHTGQHGRILSAMPGQSATSVLIHPGLGQTEALVRALEKAGYPPARTQSPKSTKPGTRRTRRPCTDVHATFTPTKCIDIAADGELRFTVALPSIYLFEQIAPFTVREQSSSSSSARYYLTQSAVRNAIERGMTVDDILGCLQRLHRRPLPRWVEIRVRAWGHYYGEAAVQTVTLVQIRDRETLSELLSQPELEGILHRFALDETKALALVSSDDLALLHELLAERGIDTKDQLD